MENYEYPLFDEGVSEVDEDYEFNDLTGSKRRKMSILNRKSVSKYEIEQLFIDYDEYDDEGFKI